MATPLTIASGLGFRLVPDLVGLSASSTSSDKKKKKKERWECRHQERVIVHTPTSPTWRYQVTHELAHATARRLGRPLPSACTPEQQAREEVLAETAALTLARRHGWTIPADADGYLRRWQGRAGDGWEVWLARELPPVLAILQ